MVPVLSRHFLPLPLHHELVLHRDFQAPFWPDYDTVVPLRLFLPCGCVYFPSYIHRHILVCLYCYSRPLSTPQAHAATHLGFQAITISCPTLLPLDLGFQVYGANRGTLDTFTLSAYIFALSLNRH